MPPVEREGFNVTGTTNNQRAPITAEQEAFNSRYATVPDIGIMCGLSQGGVHTALATGRLPTPVRVAHVLVWERNAELEAAVKRIVDAKARRGKPLTVEQIYADAAAFAANKAMQRGAVA